VINKKTVEDSAFNSEYVIIEHISEVNLKTYYVGFDFGRYRYDAFSEKLMDAIVDFAFGYHTGILKQYNRNKLKEAAKAIYRIKEYADVKTLYVDDDSELSDDALQIEDKYIKRGEFGELILHLLLRDFIKTVPLLSKIYFKDTDGATVHGFDAVHIGPDLIDPAKDSIFFGESKLYSRKDNTAGEKGVNDLIEDIKAHFTKDFLYREFALIAKKKNSFEHIEDYEDSNTIAEYTEYLKKKKHWFALLEKAEKQEVKLQDFLNSVTIPLLCTYESKVLKDHNDETTQEFLSEYEAEVRSLKELFDSKLQKIKNDVGEPIKTELNILLMLLPIPSKKNLVKVLHQKLGNQQNA